MPNALLLLGLLLAACSPAAAPTATATFIPEPIETLVAPTEQPSPTGTAEPTERTIISGFPEDPFFKEQFPREANPDGSYSFLCVVENIVVLPENQYTNLDHGYELEVYAECSYYDENGDIQTIKISLRLRNYSQNSSVSIGSPPNLVFPYSITRENYSIGGEAYKRYFGNLINVTFGPWQAGYDYLSRGYAREVINEIPGFELFAQTGNPNDLGAEWLVPLGIQNIN